MRAGLDINSAGTLDATGGAGGGEIHVDTQSDITLAGVVDASGRSTGAAGGTVTINAGTGGGGAVTVDNAIDVTSNGCSADLGCGIAGTAEVTGCHVTITARGSVRAGAPTAGEVRLTARELLTISGKVNASATTPSGTDGRIVLTHPSRQPPVIGVGLVVPVPLRLARDTCTPDNVQDCLVPCPTCGDGRIEFPATCDGAAGTPLSCDGCSKFCQLEECNDGQACTLDSCDPRLGCRHVQVPTPCIEPPSPTASATGTATVPQPPTASPTPTRIPSTTATPTALPTAGLRGDANCDGGVSAADLSALVVAFGHGVNEGCPLADVTADGVLNEADVTEVVQLMFTTASAATQ